MSQSVPDLHMTIENALQVLVAMRWAAQGLNGMPHELELASVAVIRELQACQERLDVATPLTRAQAHARRAG